MCPRGAERRLTVQVLRAAAITERRPPGDAHGASGTGGPARDQARAASQSGDGVARQPPDLEKTSRGEDPFPEHRFPRTASMGVAPEPEPLARPRTAVAFGSTGRSRRRRRGGPAARASPRPNRRGGRRRRHARAAEEGPARGGAGGALRPAAAAPRAPRQSAL